MHQTMHHEHHTLTKCASLLCLEDFSFSRTPWQVRHNWRRVLCSSFPRLSLHLVSNSGPVSARLWTSHEIHADPRTIRDSARGLLQRTLFRLSGSWAVPAVRTASCHGRPLSVRSITDGSDLLNVFRRICRDTQSICTQTATPEPGYSLTVHRRRSPSVLPRSLAHTAVKSRCPQVFLQPQSAAPLPFQY